jgi:peptidyl-dipeptidase A
MDFQSNYTVRRMFEQADRFFKGLGLVGLDEGASNFYNLSMLTKPKDGRKVVCQANARDFMATDELPGDFRSECSIVHTILISTLENMY